MAKLIAILFLLPFTTFYTDNYIQYCNPRFSFCVAVPSDFIRERAPENGDGNAFKSKDEKAEILAFGSLVADDNDDLNQEYQAVTLSTQVSYKKITANYFIYSGTEKNGDLVYRKTVRKKIDYMGEPNTYVFQTLMITYPKGSSAAYKSYCSVIAKSLQ